MAERIEMLPPNLIVHDPPSLLGDVRFMLGRYPERLAAVRVANEYEILAVLEALAVEDEVLA